MKDVRVGLLAGPVGVGKTTVAERVVRMARRRGLVCWNGERRVLARTDRELHGPTVGPYSFAQSALAWAVGVVERAMHPEQTAEGDLRGCDLIIVDEIGKLELWQGIGLAPILPRLAGGEAPRCLVLVRDFLLSELRGKLEPLEPTVFTVSEQNREGLAPRILQDLFGLASPPGSRTNI